MPEGDSLHRAARKLQVLVGQRVTEAGAFLCSSHAVDRRPDIQMHFVPAQLDDHGRHRLPGHGFTLHACYLRPRSRGQIRLRSARCDDAPLIFANYLREPGDLAVLLEAARRSREILGSAPFDACRGAEIFPGAHASSDADLTQFIREKAETVYHPVGTCRMGTDAHAVVDPALRVHSIERIACGRCVDHADDRQRQYQCTDDHDRRESRRHDCRHRVTTRIIS